MQRKYFLQVNNQSPWESYVFFFKLNTTKQDKVYSTSISFVSYSSFLFSLSVSILSFKLSLPFFLRVFQPFTVLPSIFSANLKNFLGPMSAIFKPCPTLLFNLSMKLRINPKRRAARCFNQKIPVVGMDTKIDNNFLIHNFKCCFKEDKLNFYCHCRSHAANPKLLPFGTFHYLTHH